MRVRFLGTGASGGTPGAGRSARRESSAVIELRSRLLVDVSRDFPEQCRDLGSLDGVLLTHAHRDACGGIAALRRWWRPLQTGPVPIYASRETIAALRARYRRLDHCAFVAVGDGEGHRIGDLAVMALTVPHARERRYPTYAWRVGGGGRTVVYASDVATLTPSLRRFCRGANLLIIDAAMWRRRLFSHLTIDAELPQLCGWPVERILLTQIGRSAPPHERLAREVSRICAKARPAHDGQRARV